jgi:hypothetical protein
MQVMQYSRALASWLLQCTTMLAGSILCDMEKTFDSVNHDILLSKLPYYEISGGSIITGIFRIDIKEFVSQTLILILTQSQNGPE